MDYALQNKYITDFLLTIWHEYEKHIRTDQVFQLCCHIWAVPKMPSLYVWGKATYVKVITMRHQNVNFELWICPPHGPWKIWQSADVTRPCTNAWNTLCDMYGKVLAKYQTSSQIYINIICSIISISGCRIQCLYLWKQISISNQ